MISGFMLNFLIHSSKFLRPEVHFFPYWWPLVQHHLLKSLHFLHWNEFISLSKINWPYEFGSNSGIHSVSFCVYPYTKSILSWFLWLYSNSWTQVVKALQFWSSFQKIVLAVFYVLCISACILEYLVNFL